MTLRAQYHFRPSANGYFAWDVRELISRAQSLPVIQVPLSQIAELDEMWWYQSSYDRPTPRSLSEHFRLMSDADLAYPILLCAQGRLMDGMHRCLKALALGQGQIAARRFSVTPEPDYQDVQPGDLPYD